MCKKLAHQITEDFETLDPILVCPLKGSIFFLNQIIQYLHFPLAVDFALVDCFTETCHLKKDVSLSLQKKHIIILEEVIDSGRRTDFLKRRILLSNPASIKVACLLDKTSRREISLKPDYAGMEIEDRFVVGFGMDADELGRNYRDIHIFSQ